MNVSQSKVKSSSSCDIGNDLFILAPGYYISNLGCNIRMHRHGEHNYFCTQNGFPFFRFTFVSLQHIFVCLGELLFLGMVCRQQTRYEPSHRGSAGGVWRRGRPADYRSDPVRCCCCCCCCCCCGGASSPQLRLRLRLRPGSPSASNSAPPCVEN